MSQPFNRTLYRQRRDRAAANFAQYDFLLQAATERLVDRLEDITRNFPTTLVLGSHNGLLSEAISDKNGIKMLIQSDFSAKIAHKSSQNGCLTCISDEELLPFAENSLDAVLSTLVLHHINDLPGCLSQIQHALKPDGLLLCSFWGGETLTELRQVLMQAEMELVGGVSPRIIPFADIRDVGGLLQRAGFALPIIDSDRITVTYDNMFKLIEDLRGMGETNCLAQQSPHIPQRELFMKAAALYQEQFADKSGRISASFDLITLAGWKPDSSQPKAAKRGSGKISLNTVLTD